MKKIIAWITLGAAFLLFFGTIGAYDNNAITFTQALLQVAAALPVVGVTVKYITK